MRDNMIEPITREEEFHASYYREILRLLSEINNKLGTQKEETRNVNESEPSPRRKR